nr:hypothetical protein [Thermofilum sp.]
GKPLNLRIAAFVTSFNEDPGIIKDTLLSVKAALKGRGDVYLLDDSTRPEIVKEMVYTIYIGLTAEASRLEP